MRYIILLFLFCSCAVLKRDKTTTTKQSEKTEKKIDTTSKETVNKGISDVIRVEVPVTDPEIDYKVNEILRKLNTSKSSGDNSYRLYYDEKLREIRAEFEVGETRNKEVATNNETNTEKSFEENISEYVKKIVIPWWVYVIAIFLLRKPIVGIIAFFYPPIRGLRTARDVFTPPDK